MSDTQALLEKTLTAVKAVHKAFGAPGDYGYDTPQWPLPNVWLGTSVEDQETADERIPLLLETPAAKRFVSAEPLLGPVDLMDIPWLTGKAAAGHLLDGREHREMPE